MKLIGRDLVMLDDFVHIHDNIYIGAVPIVMAHKSFEYVVNTYNHHKYSIYPHQCMVAFSMEDKAFLPPEKIINEAVEKTYEFAKKGKTLVHCHAGINRSAFIIALTLIKYYGFRPIEAINLLRNKRNREALNNKTFYNYIMNQT